MKNMKKIFALVLALMMVAGMMSAFAAGSIIVQPSSTVSLANKTLKAYKILDATYSGTGDSQAIAYTIPNSMLSFFDGYFGRAANSSANPPVAAATASELAAAAGKTVDQYVGEIMAAWGDDSAEIKNFVSAALAAAKTAGISPITGTASGDNVVFNNLAAGYYVIEDEGSATPISALMLDTVTDEAVTITLKAKDETEKEIIPAGELLNNKADELGLGRAVDFRITQKVPDYTGYDYFYFIVNDTLSAGLTFNPDSVIVKIGKTTSQTTLTKGTDYYLYYDKTDADQAAVLGNKTFIIAFENIKNYTIDDPIEITYNATVNTDAVTGINPNTNEVTIQYSRDPGKDQRGDKIPGYPANTENHPLGEGPEKWTDTYTTKVTILKIDGTTKQALPGVEFTLTGSSKDAVFKAWEVFEVDPAGEYWLLKNGTYTKTAPSTEPSLTATTGPSGWVEIASGETYTGTDIRVVGGKQYRPYKTTDGNKAHYIIVEPNAGDYVSTTVKYDKVTKSSDASEAYVVNRTGTTGSDGKLSFAQLGAGTYKLSETGILDSYNGIPDIEFTVTCTLPAASSVINGTETATWEISTNTPGVTFTPGTGNDLGTFSVTIANNQGVELPSTGGMGTTLFYIGGGILIALAVVLLVTKRRMSGND